MQHWVGAGVLGCGRQCAKGHVKPACFGFQWVLLRPWCLTIKAQALWSASVLMTDVEEARCTLTEALPEIIYPYIPFYDI